MQKQVITIDKAGVMSGLQRKPGQGIDLRQFGKADIKRASLIEWNEHEQAWYIDVLQEAGRGIVTMAKWIEAGLTMRQLVELDFIDGMFGNAPPRQTDTILFPEYDDAVKAEIAYLDALRLAGRF